MGIEGKSDDRGERGWALVSVLWGVTMLSLMALAAQDLTLTAHKTESSAWDAARADAALQAAVTQAVLGIATPDIAQRWRVDGVMHEMSFQGFKLKVTIQAESGRFDLNAIDISMLQNLLKAAGQSSDQAQKLAASILYWRSSAAGVHPLDSATENDYAAAGLAYQPRHGPFQTLDELRLVFGVTPDLFKKLRPALTVYTKRAMIDPVFAPREALLALYDGNDDQVDAIIDARNAGTEIPSELYLSSNKGVIGLGISAAGQTFTISAETHLGRRTYRRTTVVMLTGDNIHPDITLAWSR
jgi:general secretion pathway protein K